MVNVLFEMSLPPLQGLKLSSFFIHSASHHAIAKALSEQQVSNACDFKPALRSVHFADCCAKSGDFAQQGS
ncbi:hypothetical protein [Flavobacterium sp. FlaQc-48]|uniref:hypothetical protein n=1 Tax=Flavobacterium sp. FlaQc-48 TaxID=3374181 RepID=UPI003757F422